MAKLKAQSRARPSPDRAALRTGSDDSIAEPTSFLHSDLMEAIEEERSRLMKADAVLHCVLIAMEDDDDRAQAPHYPSVVELARDLVNQSINQLDSVRLSPLMSGKKAARSFAYPKKDASRRKSDEVKECDPPKYIH